MIKIQVDLYSTKEAYDFFCVELEKALEYVFSDRQSLQPNSAKNITFETEFLRSAVKSVAHKLFIQRYLLEKRNATN